MKLLGSEEKDVDKDKDGENVSKLEYMEVVLVRCNLVNTLIINTLQKFCLLLFQTNNSDSQSIAIVLNDDEHNQH